MSAKPESTVEADGGKRTLSIFYKELPDGHDVTVYRMALGRARICLGWVDDEVNVLDAYCYDDPALACVAAERWSGEGDPIDGWTRHINSGRRRIDGDPNKESVRW